MRAIMETVSILYRALRKPCLSWKEAFKAVQNENGYFIDVIADYGGYKIIR
jgi:hypothetical protein